MVLENRRGKVELYEQIRREYEHGAGTIRAVARKLGVHRRDVRKALASAVPAEREMPEREVAESSVRRYVRQRKTTMGLLGQETFVPQSYTWGSEGQVDWYEGWAEFDGESRKAYLFCLRSMASGGAFHRAYPHATQQAFLEAHELAFAYFGGVFRVLRYDNLKSAVKKILRGHQREETARFIAFRSHWGFESEFCT